jgi:hypothetical protein
LHYVEICGAGYLIGITLIASSSDNGNTFQASFNKNSQILIVHPPSPKKIFVKFAKKAGSLEIRSQYRFRFILIFR